MTADFLVGSVIPVAVIITMLAVGLNLELSALRDSLRQPRSFLLCLVLQIVLLPVAVLALIALLSPPPLLAVVMFAVAMSPGGTLSNALTHLARGNLALCVVLTMATTLLVAFTAPAIAGLASVVGAFGAWAPGSLSPATIAFDLFRVALLPICIGVTLGALLPGLASRLRRPVDVLCGLAIAAVVASSGVVSWPVVRTSALDFVVPAAALSFVLLAVGGAVAMLLPGKDRSACVIEFCVRNLPIAVILSAGAGPSAQILAFLLCHFVVNTALLVALALGRRRGGRPGLRSKAAEKQSLT
jgi:BASS family bile acid:Na+ symporter